MKNIFILLLLSLTPLSSYTLNRPLSTDLISTEPTLQSIESDEMTERQRIFIETVKPYGTFFKDKNQVFIVIPLSLAYEASLYHQILYDDKLQNQPFMQLIAIDVHHNLAIFTPNLRLINAHSFSNTFPFSTLDTSTHDPSIKREVIVKGLHYKSSSFHGITVPYLWQSPEIIDIHTVNTTPSTTLGEGRPVFNSENNQVIGIQSKIRLKAIQVVSANVVYDLLQQAQNQPLTCLFSWTSCIDTLLESLQNTQDPITQFQFSLLYRYIVQTSSHINKNITGQALPTTQNKKLSIQFLKKSAEQNYPPAMHMYASYLLIQSIENAQKSLGLFRQAVQHMYAPSLFYIGKELVLYTEKKENESLFQLALGEEIDPNLKEEKRKEGLQLIQHASYLNYPPARNYLKNQAQQ